MVVKFKRKVSKGSRFNQIYVPKNMEPFIEAGDEVEVRLVRKFINVHYSTDLKKLPEFKEDLIKNIFSFLSNIPNVSSMFVVGSFLTEKINYNDIDVVLITSNWENNFEETVFNKLIEKFNLKFHILTIEGKKFDHLLRICPLTRAMFSKFICNNQFAVSDGKSIDERHINFLLMMPEDLLEIKLGSRIFFDSIRRLITIEKFLRKKSLDILMINDDVKKLVNNRLYNIIRNNKEIEENSINALRKIIKIKLVIIKKLIENGKN